MFDIFGKVIPMMSNHLIPMMSNHLKIARDLLVGRAGTKYEDVGCVGMVCSAAVEWE